MNRRRWKFRISLLIVLLFITSGLNIYSIISKQDSILNHNNQGLNESSKYIIVDKSDDKKFQNIQEAIDFSQTESTIYVKNGIYNEILNINKKINIYGESKDKTIINPTSNKNGYAIKISYEDTIMNNLGIQNQGPGLYSTGIKITANKVTITSCDIYNTPVGIAVWSSENKITDCRFYNCSDEGIALLGSEINLANNNIIKNCEFFNNCDGIELQYSSNNEISSCIFKNNTHAGIDAIETSNNDNLISDCTFENNNAFGIFFSNSKNNIISKCKITGCKIMATSSKNIKLEECNFEKIYLTDKSSMTFQNCSNFLKTNINTIDSNYKILYENKLKAIFSNIIEKREDFYLKISSLISFFSLKY